MCEIVYNILITNFTVYRCIIRSNAPSNLQMQPLGCIFVYALNCITFGTAIDPCCGSGGMFVQSAKFVENHSANISNISIYGQDSNPTTWKMELNQILEPMLQIRFYSAPKKYCILLTTGL